MAVCRCCIGIPSARNNCMAFIKLNILEPLFCDVSQARNKAQICRAAGLLQHQSAQKPLLHACAFMQKHYLIFFVGNFKVLIHFMAVSTGSLSFEKAVLCPKSGNNLYW